MRLSNSLSASHLMDTSNSFVSGEQLLSMLNASLLWVGIHREQLNRQNVYPVPDGDTGVNMWLTLQSACQSAERSQLASADALWRSAAQGALEGSRGNSGVILSQYMKGMGEDWQEEPCLTVADFKRGVAGGSVRAYAAVDSPQEGTMLTVARDVATVAQSLADDISMAAFLDALVQEAQMSVVRTPDLLPVLKQAGVVDAGGWGLALFLEGMLKGLRGEVLEGDITPEAKEAPAPAPMRFTVIPDRVHGFDVQFLMHQPRLTVDTLRDTVASMGDFPLVDGDSDLVKVHVHVLDPGPVLSWACRIGFITDVVVENMDAMAAVAQTQVEQETAKDFAEGQIRLMNPAQPDETAVVAVSSTPGFSELFTSLGVNCLIECGHSFNPSVGQFKEAIALACGARTILLPNNRNAAAAARQASADLPDAAVAVLETPFVTNGIAAMYGFEQSLPWTQLLDSMQAQAARIVHGSLARSSRDVASPRGQVEAGHWVALAHGHDVLAGSPDFPTALRSLVEEFLLPTTERQTADDYDLITVYRGEDATTEMDQALAALLTERADAFDVEWVDTLQPHHAYLLVME